MIRRIVLQYDDTIRKNFGKQKYQDEIKHIITYQRRNHFIRKLTLDLKGNTLVLYNYVEKHGKPLYENIKMHADLPLHLNHRYEFYKVLVEV